MDKIKRISAALIAMSLACSMMASCGSDDSSSENAASKAADSASTADAAESTADAAESTEDGAASEGDAESEADSEDGASDYDPAEITPDMSYVHNYEFAGYDAYLMFADRAGWFWRNMMAEGSVYREDFDETDEETYGYGVDADIVGDGEYTVSITKDSIYQNNGMINAQTLINEDDGTIFAAEGCCVFCIDIVGICNGDFGSGKNEDTGEWEVSQPLKNNPLDDSLDNHWEPEAKGDYDPGQLTVKVTSIKCDGVEIDYDESKFFYGNIESQNNCYRIEIYNDYGNTATDPGIDPMGLYFNKSLEVSFTIEGLGEVKTFPEYTVFTPSN